MTLARRFTAFLTVLLLASLAGCASTSKQEGAGQYTEDAYITTKVKAAFVKDPLVKALDIHVETDKGVVLLSGFVSSQAEIDQASKVARGVKGVVDVKNDLRLK